MARKFVLVPHDMYQGLLGGAEDTVAHARAELDSTLFDPSTSVAEKNLLYNKRLFDFMKLRKEALERPVKVEVSNPPPAPSQPAPARALEAVPATPSVPIVQPTPKTTRKRRSKGPQLPNNVNQLLRIVDADRAHFGVDEKGRVLNARGRAIPHSEHLRILSHLLYPEEGGMDPPGTSDLKLRIATSDRTRRYLYPGGENIQEGAGQSKRFRPTLWKF